MSYSQVGWRSRNEPPEAVILRGWRRQMQWRNRSSRSVPPIPNPLPPQGVKGLGTRLSPNNRQNCTKSFSCSLHPLRGMGGVRSSAVEESRTLAAGFFYSSCINPQSISNSGNNPTAVRSSIPNISGKPYCPSSFNVYTITQRSIGWVIQYSFTP